MLIGLYGLLEMLWKLQVLLERVFVTPVFYFSPIPLYMNCGTGRF